MESVLFDYIFLVRSDCHETVLTILYLILTVKYPIIDRNEFESIILFL